MTSSTSTILDYLNTLPDLAVVGAEMLVQPAQDLFSTWEDCLLVQPQTPTALREILKLAHQHQWRSIVMGTGSKLTWGNPPQPPKLLITTQKLNRVLDHAVGDLTITVEAGATLAQVQQILRTEGQFLPIDPAYPQTATLGGIVATADTGSLRHRYSGVRDLLLGIEIIRADGERAKAGGRVVKNVAGYDLMKLFTGSYGTLGAIAQLTFRTYALPPEQATLWTVGEPDAIAALTAQILGSSLTPTAIDLLSPGVVAQIEGAESGNGAIGLMLRFATVPESIAVQTQTVRTWARSLNLTCNSLTGEDAQQCWQQVNTLTRQPQTSESALIKLGTLPTSATAFLTQLPTTVYGCIYAGSGLGQLHCAAPPTATDLKRWRRLCEQHQGFLSLLHGPIALKTDVEPWGYTKDAQWLMQRLKQEFDPHNLLHSGCFVGRI